MQQGRALQLAVLSVSLLTILVGTALSPVLSELRRAFPEVGEEWIQLVLTLPALFLVPVSLLSPWLTARIPLRRLLLAGLTLYLVGGLGPAAARTFPQLCRTTIDIGQKNKKG